MEASEVMADWKKKHADDAEAVFDNESVQMVMDEFADNMGFKLEGLPKYGMHKVVSYVAQVARAQALGFDPELLRHTAEEADVAGLALARTAVAKGVPTWVIRGDDAQRID